MICKVVCSDNLMWLFCWKWDVAVLLGIRDIDNRRFGSDRIVQLQAHIIEVGSTLCPDGAERRLPFFRMSFHVQSFIPLTPFAALAISDQIFFFFLAVIVALSLPFSLLAFLPASFITIPISSLV